MNEAIAKQDLITKIKKRNRITRQRTAGSMGKPLKRSTENKRKPHVCVFKIAPQTSGEIVDLPRHTPSYGCEVGGGGGRKSQPWFDTSSGRPLR